MSKLYALGSNGNGQLGVGHLEDINKPTACLGIPDDEVISKVTGGGNHSAAISRSGRLFIAGFSQLGDNHMNNLTKQSEEGNEEWMQFTERYNHMSWRDVACGWNFTILLANTRKLYGVGTSLWNELAGPSSEELVEIDHNQLTDIVSIACGWRHVVALNQQGQVFGWGVGRHGQLGPSIIPAKDKKDARDIRKIDMPQPIIQIACGHLHTLLRGKDGTVYGFGSNKYGQLGDIQEGNIVQHDSVFIDAGWHHSISLNANGDLKIWGRNDHGQLANQQLNIIKTAACGSEHTIAITKDTGKAIAWGWNEHGNCSTDKDFVDEPATLDQSDNVKIVGAGCATSWFVL